MLQSGRSVATNKTGTNGSNTTTKKHPTVLETFTNCTPYDKKAAQRKVITDVVAVHIAKDIVLLYTVEKLKY